ncbi:hypothetical protein DFJ67_3150 [Asanoa ferruginea]|uniref:Uncharacterized protein n=1 Tax=Asanoa ferruginea TaxID=53367 RepID=A0A3D9ZMJ9_9ACTN|nr:DUF6507 family protein [Asanoa ferruginea]REF97153.1 hypothetical protein DFJ67_3150 [Asanoa ferruginea]GIF50103.1 hypothetical protein Afe04nite_46420 [Asanoa ferruginea]
MARYRIEPLGVRQVVNTVDAYARDQLAKASESTQDAVEAATTHLDPMSPVRGLLSPFGLAVSGQLKAVYAATSDVLSAAANATNAYVEADLEMARRGANGEVYVSGSVGDRAQHAGAREAGGLAALPRQDADNARNGSHPSLADWLAQVNGGKP